MYQFTGIIKNEFRPEAGVNIIVRGLKDKVILAPSGFYYDLDHKQDNKTLTLTLSPSSGTTAAPCALNVEVEKGTEKTATEPGQWQVEITASSQKDPAKVTITVVKNLQ